MKVTVTVKNWDMSSPANREHLATLASQLLGVSGYAYTHSKDIPYMPNEGDTSYWTLDAGNDWKIKFLDTNTFELIQRYQINDCSRAHEVHKVNEGVKALAGFLAYRLNGVCTVYMEA